MGEVCGQYCAGGECWLLLPVMLANTGPLAGWLLRAVGICCGLGAALHLPIPPTASSTLMRSTPLPALQWVYDIWYTSLTPDREFPAEVRRLLNTGFGQLAGRARQLDLRLVMNDLCELVMEQVGPGAGGCWHWWMLMSAGWWVLMSAGWWVLVSAGASGGCWQILVGECC